MNCGNTQLSKQQLVCLPRNVMQAWPMPSCGICLSVCLSVCQVRRFCRNEQTCFQFFFTIGYSHTILVFPYQTSWLYINPTGTPLRGHRMQVGYAEIAILSQYLAPSRAVNAKCNTLRQIEAGMGFCCRCLVSAVNGLF